ncbi:MAG: hypothetical protein ACKONH_09540 [Planctomycetia bacterium]
MGPVERGRAQVAADGGAGAGRCAGDEIDAAARRVVAADAVVLRVDDEHASLSVEGHVLRAGQERRAARPAVAGVARPAGGVHDRADRVAADLDERVALAEHQVDRAIGRLAGRPRADEQRLQGRAAVDRPARLPVAGTGTAGFGGDGGPAAAAAFDQAYCGAAAPDGRSLLVADLQNKRLRRVDLVAGTVSTVAGNGQAGKPVDGSPPLETPLVGPRAACQAADGTIYLVLREGHALVEIRGNAIRTVVNASGRSGYAGDGGPGRAALLAGPKYVALDQKGRVLIVDTENHCIRRYDPPQPLVLQIGHEERPPVGRGRAAVGLVERRGRRRAAVAAEARGAGAGHHRHRARAGIEGPDLVAERVGHADAAVGGPGHVVQAVEPHVGRGRRGVDRQLRAVGRDVEPPGHERDLPGAGVRAKQPVAPRVFHAVHPPRAVEGHGERLVDVGGIGGLGHAAAGIADEHFDVGGAGGGAGRDEDAREETADDAGRHLVHASNSRSTSRWRGTAVKASSAASYSSVTKPW